MSKLRYQLVVVLRTVLGLGFEARLKRGELCEVVVELDGVPQGVEGERDTASPALKPRFRHDTAESTSISTEHRTKKKRESGRVSVHPLRLYQRRWWTRVKDAGPA